ncbi:hypothetical protein ACFE04_023268 [Oxalis oulophora]
MAESIKISSKRERDEEERQVDDVFKRQKSYNDLLSLLDSDEEEQNEDLSSIITTLQREISSSDVSDSLSVTHDDDDAEKERVMRHLLEASDDELGIPNISGGEVDDDAVSSSGGGGGGGEVHYVDDDDNKLFNGYDDGLFWELEDDVANYYTVLQSQLFSMM